MAFVARCAAQGLAAEMGGSALHRAITPFRHLAFFPDMAPQWRWMRDRTDEGGEVLNLFGYTGVGTLALAAKGASMTHVDASKKSVEAGQRQRLALRPRRPAHPLAGRRCRQVHRPRGPARAAL